MLKSLETIGAMAIIHAVAMIFNYFRLEYQGRSDRVWPCIIATAIYFILTLASLPVSIASLLLQKLYQARSEQIHTRELIKKANESYALGKKNEELLRQEIDKLKEERFDISIERYDEGKTTGYKSGYIDGYVASCEKALSEENLHLQHDWQWKHNTRSAAQESLQFKEYMDQVWEETQT